MKTGLASKLIQKPGVQAIEERLSSETEGQTANTSRRGAVPSAKNRAVPEHGSPRVGRFRVRNPPEHHFENRKLVS